MLTGIYYAHRENGEIMMFDIAKNRFNCCCVEFFNFDLDGTDYSFRVMFDELERINAQMKDPNVIDIDVNMISCVLIDAMRANGTISIKRIGQHTHAVYLDDVQIVVLNNKTFDSAVIELKGL